MSTKKEHLFTIAAAFNIVKNAVSKVTKCNSANTDRIVFNSLNKTIHNAADKKESK